MKFIFALMLFPLALMAAEAPKMRVHVYSEGKNAEVFRGKGFALDKGKDGSGGNLLSPQARAPIFRRAGLDPYTKEMDEADLSRMQMRLSRFDLERIKSLYPKIPENTLARAQAELKKAGAHAP